MYSPVTVPFLKKSARESARQLLHTHDQTLPHSETAHGYTQQYSSILVLSMPPVVESIMLETNPMADAALAFFSESILNGMSKKDILRQLQGPAIIYACQGVKRNGGQTDTKKRDQAVTAAYKKVVVPGFLKWLSERDPEFCIPHWLTLHMMGCTTVSATGDPNKRSELHLAYSLP